MTLSIIIVNWNVWPLLERCLDSIQLYAKNLDYEIFVVDNASQDNSPKFLKEIAHRQKRVKVILNKENLGFARANNLALEQARGKFVLFLNPDTEIRSGTLPRMLDFFKAHPRCGVAGCRLVGLDGATQLSVRNFPTLTSQILIFLKLHHLFPDLPVLRNYLLYDFDYEREQKVEQVMGAFLMARREVLEELGSFDENFFLWFEEVDFCKRVKESKWEVYYTPRAKIFHYQAQSFQQVFSFRRQRIYNRSAIYYFRKHFPSCQAEILIALAPFSLLLAYFIQLWTQLLRKIWPRRCRFRL